MEQNTKKRLYTGVLAAVVAGITAGSVRLVQLLREADPHFVGMTKFGPATVFSVPDSAGRYVRVLAVGRSVQSASYIEGDKNDAPFAYQRAFDVVCESFVPRTEQGRIATLMLGGGGYAWPKHAVAHLIEVDVDVVECDPKMTEIARRWLFLDELIWQSDALSTGRLGLICDDAESYVQRCDKCYSAIIDDAFTGMSPDDGILAPHNLSCVHELLLPGGLFIINAVERAGKLDRPRELILRLSQEFSQVYVVPATDTDFSDDNNYLVIASDVDLPIEGSIDL